MQDLYTSGKYLEETQTWHAEDSPWKASHIWQLIDKNELQLDSIVDVGCGSGAILSALSDIEQLKNTKLEGYDISPQAIELAVQKEKGNLRFYNDNVLGFDRDSKFDLLLAIDVFEHVPDYLGFLNSCRDRAKYKIYHIPLDLHVSALMRGSITSARYTIGHIHYFDADSAMCALKDTGHVIVDSFYTKGATDLFFRKPSFKKGVANIPRWLFSFFSTPLAARLFGGYSLMVLAE